MSPEQARAVDQLAASFWYYSSCFIGDEKKNSECDRTGAF